MEILIIEDEAIAAERLQMMIQQADKSMEVLEVLDTVSASQKWLQENPAPDLIFLDIQLADGLSFEIFETVKIESPIIFTTAYDHYALKAFKLNSIDYLLKPMVQDELEAAIKKFKTNIAEPQLIDTQELINMMSNRSNKKYKERFVIKVGDHIKTVLTRDVTMFYGEDKATYLLSNNSKKFIIDYSLDQLVEMLHPNSFFRINRKFIINVSEIADIVMFSNSRLKIVLNNVNETNDMIVARDRVSDFKRWLDR